MDYAAVAALYLSPDLARHPRPAVWNSPARRLRDALEPIATQGWWARGVHEHAAVGALGFFENYVWGRAAALGEPAADVVVAAFGVFEPSFLSAAYEGGRAKVSREDMLTARQRGATESLAAVLAPEPVAEVAHDLLAAVESLDAIARPLFSGVRALPVPDDPYGRLWRAAELVREHRGDGHLAACVTAGLDPVESNLMTELRLGYAPGEYTATRGFDDQRIADALAGLERRGWVAAGRLSEAGQAVREAVEEATDRTQDGLMARLGDRVEQIIARADRWSAMLVAAAGAPTDPRKRAAG